MSYGTAYINELQAALAEKDRELSTAQAAREEAERRLAELKGGE